MQNCSAFSSLSCVTLAYSVQSTLEWIPCFVALFIFISFSIRRIKNQRENEKIFVWTTDYKKFCLLCKLRQIIVFLPAVIAGIRLIPTIRHSNWLEALSALFELTALVMLTYMIRQNRRVPFPDRDAGPLLAVLVFGLCRIPEIILDSKRGRSDLLLYHSTFRKAASIGQFCCFCISAILLSISHTHNISTKAQLWPERWVSLTNRVFFAYIWRLLVKGYRKLLVPDDLWKLDDTQECVEKASREFVRHYPPETTRKLSTTLLLIHWRLCLVAVILGVTKCVCSFVGVFSIKWMITLTSDKTEPRWHGIAYVILLFVSQFLETLCRRHMEFVLIKVGIRMNAALSAAAFRKALRLSPLARRQFGPGEIVNLMFTDTCQLLEHVTVLPTTVTAPIELVLGTYFLYTIVGNACWAGVGVLGLILVANMVSGRCAEKYMDDQYQYRDERLRVLSEVVKNIKSLKFYAWEGAFQKYVNTIREKELAKLKKASYFYGSYNIFFTYSTYLFCIAVFIALALTGNVLLPNMAFVLIVLVESVFEDAGHLPFACYAWHLISLSTKRLQKFLQAEEMSEYVQKSPYSTGGSPPRIVITRGKFKWNPTGTSVLDGINLRIDRGQLLAVIGPVGSGKSSLLSAMTDEVYVAEGSVRIRGSVAYVPQQAWILNATLRDNVTFGLPYVQEQYDRVVSACGLDMDFGLLPAGDGTEIGERGINLSGGQKQRVSLARAVYQDRDIYLLDDPLSAVDVHVQQEIFELVIGPRGLLRDKIRVLVTHASSVLTECDRVLVLNDGRITQFGTPDEVNIEAFERTLAAVESSTDERVSDPASPTLRKASAAAARIRRRTTTSLEEVPDEIAQSTSAGLKLIDEEDMDIGRVSCKTFYIYLKACGPAVLGFVFFTVVTSVADAAFFLWLQSWTDWNARDKRASQGSMDSEIIAAEKWNLSRLGLISLAQIILCVATAACYIAFSIRAARTLHERLLSSVLRARQQFFWTTPDGRILNRFSRDMYAVDTAIPQSLAECVALFDHILFRWVLSAYATPMLAVVILVAFSVMMMLQRFYANTSRQLKRLEATTRSPIVSCGNECVQGTDSIRVFNQTHRFVEKFDRLLNENVRSRMIMFTASRWFETQIGIIGSVVFGFAILLAYMQEDISPGLVGLSLAAQAPILNVLYWAFEYLDQLERELVAMERIKHYLVLQSEAPWFRDETDKKKDNDKRSKRRLKMPKIRNLFARKRAYGTFENESDTETDHVHMAETPFDLQTYKDDIPMSWPESGKIEFVHYSTRYNETLPLALRNINMTINGGQKVAIVGRTGAGKSSLALALSRILEPSSGRILIDSVDISRLGLHELRSKITFIPQDPALFGLTLRRNLDPQEVYGEAALWMALELSHLKPYVSLLPGGLDFMVDEGGSNLSIGQRQLLCLARAILRQSKILILDEPTASIDLQTDALIQTTVREQFADCTVITIAHRLETIYDYDRVAVFANGQIEEYGNIRDLLRTDNSKFRAMIEKSGLRAHTE